MKTNKQRQLSVSQKADSNSTDSFWVNVIRRITEYYEYNLEKILETQKLLKLPQTKDLKLRSWKYNIELLGQTKKGGESFGRERFENEGKGCRVAAECTKQNWFDQKMAVSLSLNAVRCVEEKL